MNLDDKDSISKQEVYKGSSAGIKLPLGNSKKLS